MVDALDFLNLGKWATVVLVIVALWRWVIKDLLEKWFQNKLDIRKQEVESALNIQKDIAIRESEFQKIKLERVLPLLENMNSVISEHKLMNNSYASWIANKAGIPEGFEEKRVDLDGQLLKSLYASDIYLPNQLREVIRQIRKIVSCSWKDPSSVYYLLLEKGGISCVYDVCNDANDVYGDLLSCFYDMCNNYLGTRRDDQSYTDILNRHGFSSDVKPIFQNSAQRFLWSYILVHEYVSGEERSEVLAQIEREYNASRD